MTTFCCFAPTMVPENKSSFWNQVKTSNYNNSTTVLLLCNQFSYQCKYKYFLNGLNENSNFSWFSPLLFNEYLIYIFTCRIRELAVELIFKIIIYLN